MPAVTSSPMTPVLDQLAGWNDVGGSDVDVPSLLAVLARVSDPRARRGVRHRLTVVLVIGVCAVLGGMRSFVAIAQWARDSIETCPQLRECLGVSRAPAESTIRRTLQRVDPAELDLLLGWWAQQHTRPSDGRRVIAIDGKTLRGSRAADGAAASSPCRVRPHPRSRTRPGRRRGEDQRGADAAGPARRHRHRWCRHHRRRHARGPLPRRIPARTGSPLRSDREIEPARAPRATGPAALGPGVASLTAAAKPGTAAPRPAPSKPSRSPRRPDPAATVCCSPTPPKPSKSSGPAPSGPEPRLSNAASRPSTRSRRWTSATPPAPNIGGLRPRSLGRGEPAPLRPGRDLGRRPITDPDRPRTPGHGIATQPRPQHPAPDRRNQHRRRTPTPRHQPNQTTQCGPDQLTHDFAGALRSHHP